MAAALRRISILTPLFAAAAVLVGLLYGCSGGGGGGYGDPTNPNDPNGDDPNGMHADSGATSHKTNGGNNMCRSGGAQCTSYGECCSKTCTEGMCADVQCKAVAQSCYASSDCCSNSCSNGKCAQQTCKSRSEERRV